MATTHTGTNTERLAFGNYAETHGDRRARAHEELRRLRGYTRDVDRRPRRDERDRPGLRPETDQPVSFRLGTDARAELAPQVSSYDVVWPLPALMGRLMLAAIFAVSGTMKLLDPTAATAYMIDAGIPEAGTLVYVAAAAELAGALALVLGLLTRVAAVGLLLFLVPATYFFHDFWNLEGTAALAQQVNFFKNLAIGGGLFMILASGPGRFSLDYRAYARRHRYDD